MLTAIANGKAGRIRLPGSADGVSWRDVFKRREDLLTAVFFGRLRYLSDESITSVIGMLIGQYAAESLGQIQECEFWPHLTGLKERAWVEPDVLLHFENALVLVEVKPPFGGGQYIEQWKAEVHALVAECLAGERELPERVHFLALGRNSLNAGDYHELDFDTRGCFELHIHTREWEPIVEAIPELIDSASRMDGAIFEDWVSAFELFGIHIESKHVWSDLVVWQKQPLLLNVLALWTVEGSMPAKPAHLKQSCNGLTWDSLFDYVHNNPVSLKS